MEVHFGFGWQGLCKVHIDVVGVSDFVAILSSTYKCNFLGADNKQ